MADGVILLLIIPLIFFILLSQNPKPDPASEKIIREVAAKQLNKDPNELKDEDLAKITSFVLPSDVLVKIELTDIKLLEKFINLQTLYLQHISYPEKSIPRWMFIMAKLGIINPEERFALDLSPIEKLDNLERLTISNTNIRNIKPLAGLINLKQLSFYSTQVNNFTPLKNLSNLNTLYLNETSASDLTSIKYLTNLKYLYISGSDITNLEPLKELKNLILLRIYSCGNITNEQIEDLQKALPNLKIER